MKEIQELSFFLLQTMLILILVIFFLLNKFKLPYDIYNIFIDILKDKKNLTFKKGNSIFIIIDKKKI